MRKFATLLIAASVYSAAQFNAFAVEKRSKSELAAFKRANPCPSTGQRRGACPGHVIDHIHPLCAGGADTVENMQWQARAESFEKDKDERRLCRALKLNAKNN